jgi:hypothetical protein
MRSETVSLVLLLVCLSLAVAACGGTIGAVPDTPAPATQTPAASPMASHTLTTQATRPASTTPLAPGVTTSSSATPAPTRPATASPIPAPTATAIPPAPSPSPVAATIIAFSAAPTTTQRLGETITLSWQAQGSEATLCPYVLTIAGPAPQAAACIDVPLAGARTMTVSESALAWDGLLLRVTGGVTAAQATAPVTLGCQGLYDWFFAKAPARCPGAAAVSTRAAAQPFEHGVMIWLEQPDRFYVFYDETPRVFEWLEAPYRFKPGASPHNRIGVTPPAGRFEPVSGFGQLWRDEIEGAFDVRGRLGWATAAEFSFTARYQCARPAASGRLWTCFLSTPDGKVLALRPDSTAQVRFIWEEIAP